MFSRFAKTPVGLTAQQSYDRNTFRRRGNNAVTQILYIPRKANGATCTRDVLAKCTTLSWR
jgi:hypothetical protein